MSAQKRQGGANEGDVASVEVTNDFVAPRVFYVEIPMTPPAELSPNARTHHKAKAKLVASLRAAAKFATIDAMNQDPEAAEAIRTARLVKTVWEVKWEPRRQTTQDQRNVRGMLKAQEDGIAEALGVNDRKFDDVGLRQSRDENGMGCVCVSLYPIMTTGHIEMVRGTEATG